jgi:hypothetical protein
VRRGALVFALACGLSAQVMAGEPRPRYEQASERAMTPPPDRAGWWRAHLADTAMHAAATSADIASSRGLAEVNPILRDSRGQLGARGIGIKLGIFAAVELAKWRIARRHPQDRWVRALSLAPAALYVGAASHNWRIR